LTKIAESSKALVKESVNDVERVNSIMQTEERKSAPRNTRMRIITGTVTVSIIHNSITKEINEVPLIKDNTHYEPIEDTKVINNLISDHQNNDIKEEITVSEYTKDKQDEMKYEEKEQLKALTQDLNKGNNGEMFERLLKSVNMIKEVLQSNLKLREQVHELTQRVGQQNTELFHMQCECEDQKEKIQILSKSNTANNVADELIQLRKEKLMLEQRVNYLESESTKMNSSKPFSNRKESGTDDNEPVRSIVNMCTLAPIKKINKRANRDTHIFFRPNNSKSKISTNKASAWIIADNLMESKGKRGDSLAIKRMAEPSFKSIYDNKKNSFNITIDRSDTIDIKENMHEDKIKSAYRIANNSTHKPKWNKPNFIYFDNA